ncbi:Cof-type HAD-IIB family hydrolase [Neisseria sp. ZJ106]|uniref:Cof-type HAD-IIB family hydrolase n=1 Tax=Neisseria lisongii TaxID=2912188 RepID=A0ABY7RIA4_9NEIS|nr:Cof-type HAD-IIB family hydrolase [Neisseria lisongii]MCF7522145.1 Cof-type HAD-IIB family hydrolase [Neisseria lisongii]WCL70908.1 Cof-type HAD-IIB family hydrolase [Neisseria lisongii]
MTPKIIFFDIDDTLYRKYTDTLRPSVLQAMNALKAKGILTAIATGRTPAAFPEKIKQLIRQCGMDMLISINGQYIEYQGKMLQSYPMDEADIHAVIAVLQRKNIPYAFVGTQHIAVSERNTLTENTLASILTVCPEDPHYYQKHEVYQMLAFYPPQQDGEISPDIEALGLKTVRWHENAVDILRSGGSKAVGIAHSVAKLGIAMQDVMAFGDGMNDIEMLQTVGFGVAMGNGEPQAKAAARHVCPSVDEDGVYRGLQELGIID